MQLPDFVGQMLQRRLAALLRRLDRGCRRVQGQGQRVEAQQQRGHRVQRPDGAAASPGPPPTLVARQGPRPESVQQRADGRAPEQRRGPRQKSAGRPGTDTLPPLHTLQQGKQGGERHPIQRSETRTVHRPMLAWTSCLTDCGGILTVLGIPSERNEQQPRRILGNGPVSSAVMDVGEWDEIRLKGPAHGTLPGKARQLLMDASGPHPP